MGLDTNLLQGAIPPELGVLNLLNFTAHINNLEGTIPEEIWQITTLQQLRLGSNSLSGTISNRIGDLMAVEELFLNNNRLEGSIPLFLARLSTMGKCGPDDHGIRLSTLASHLASLFSTPFLCQQQLGRIHSRLVFHLYRVGNL